MTATPFDLVALDIAGTTVDEGGTVYQVLRESVTAAGVSVTAEQVGRWMGADKRDAIRGLLGPGVRADRLDQIYTDFSSRLKARYAAAPPVPFRGVPQALTRLREAGVAVALTTGFDRETTETLLEALGWNPDSNDSPVDVVICADDVPAGRPAPYMIYQAMQRTGTQIASRVLVAGDTVLDLDAGTNAGAGYVVGVLTGGMDAAQLGRTRHTHLLTSAADIPGLMTTR